MFFQEQKSQRIFQLLIAGASLVFLFCEFRRSDFSFLQTNQLRSFWYFYAFLLFALMFLNWLAEAWKWKLSVENIEEISTSKALKQIWIGVAAGFFTPARLGEIPARGVQQSNRKAGTGIAAVNSLAQSAVTSLFGLFGSIYLFWNFGTEFFPKVQLLGFTLFILLLASSFLVLFFKQRLIRFYRNFLKGKFRIIVALSALRYLIFCLQFLSVFYVLKNDFPIVGSVAAIGAYYLINTLLPVITVAEAGVKAFTANLIFPLVGIASEHALLAALSVWAINLLVPVIVGNFWLLSPALHHLLGKLRR